MTDRPPIFGLPTFGSPFNSPVGSPFRGKIEGVSPDKIPNLELWLKADEGITFNGSDVSAWADQSGNGRNATQATASRQPLYVASVINGLPAVQFDGVDTTGTFMSVDLTFLASSSMSIYAVIRRSSAKNSNFFLGSGVTPIGANTSINCGWNVDAIYNFAFLSNDLLLTVPPFTSAIPNLAVNRFSVANGKSAQIIRSGVEASDTEPGQTTALVSSVSGRIGRGFDDIQTYFAGDISELIIYSRFVSTTENDQVQAYSAKKYNLTLP